MATGVLKARVGGSWVPVTNAGTGGGSVNGPVTSLAGRVAIWNDTVGTTLADSGIVATAIVLTADARLSDARAPTVHANTHKAGGADPLALDQLAATTDIVTLNASTTAHGLLPKLPGSAAVFLRGDGTWASASGGAPGAHAASHAAGGADPVSVATLAGYPANTTTWLRGDGTFSSTVTGGLTLAGPLLFSSDAVLSRTTADGADTGALTLAGGGASGPTRGAWITVNGNDGNTGLLQLFPGGVTGSRIDMYRNDGSTPMFVLDGGTGNLLATSTTISGWSFNSTHNAGGYVQIQKTATAVVNVGAATAMGLGLSTWDAAINAVQASLFLEAAVAIKSGTIYRGTAASAANLYVASDGQISRSVSSLRYKTNVAPLEDVDWRWLLRALPIKFNERKDPHGRVYAGLAAEHVAAAAPMFTVFNAEGEPEEVAYGHLTAPIIRALQDLDTRLHLLEGRT